MSRKSCHRLLTVVSLSVMPVLLAGCPKTSVPGAARGVGTGTTQGSASVSLGPGGASDASRTESDALVAAAGPGAGTMLPALPSPKDFIETGALSDVHFDFDRYSVRTQDVPVLDANARWFKTNAGTLILIEGHGDERGTNEYNLALGDRRAKATRDQLIARGVAPSRITIITYGEERPLCTQHTESCWASNRRGHFLVSR